MNNITGSGQVFFITGSTKQRQKLRKRMRREEKLSIAIKQMQVYKNKFFYYTLENIWNPLNGPIDVSASSNAYPVDWNCVVVQRKNSAVEKFCVCDLERVYVSMYGGWPWPSLFTMQCITLSEQRLSTNNKPEKKIKVFV